MVLILFLSLTSSSLTRTTSSNSSLPFYFNVMTSPTLLTFSNGGPFRLIVMSSPYNFSTNLVTTGFYLLSPLLKLIVIDSPSTFLIALLPSFFP
jgi:hypothetical protein